MKIHFEIRNWSWKVPLFLLRFFQKNVKFFNFSFKYIEIKAGYQGFKVFSSLQNEKHVFEILFKFRLEKSKHVFEEFFKFTKWKIYVFETFWSLQNEKHVLEAFFKFTKWKTRFWSIFQVYKMKNTFLKCFSSLD